LLIVFLLYGRFAAKLEKNLAHGLGKRAIDRATAGAFVASAAEIFGHVRDVQFAFAAETHAISSVRQFPKKRRDLDAANG
jgi:hypothetical protein